MKFISIAVKDLLQLVRDKQTILFLILMPVLFTLFFVLIFGGSYGSPDDSGEETGYTIGVLDETGGSLLSRKLLSLLSEKEYLDFRSLTAASLEEVRRTVADGNYAAVLLITPAFRFEQKFTGISLVVDYASAAGKTAKDLLTADIENAADVLKIAGISLDIRSNIKPFASESEREEYFTGGIELAEEAREENAVGIVKRTVSPAPRDSGPSIDAKTQFSPGLMVQFAVFGLITSAMVLMLERKSGTMKRVLTCPVSRAAVIGGHTAAMFITVCFQEMILIVFGALVFGVPYFSAPPALFIMVISIAAWAAGLGLFIGSISKSEEQVIVLSLLAMFVFAVLGGAWFPLELTGKTFAEIGKFVPSYWGIRGLQNIIVRGLGTMSVLAPAAVQLAYAVFFFLLALWRFRSE